jgi:hypothetical protein
MPVGESEEDEAGDIGELGEEIVKNEMNDVPIERPKCLSGINMTGNLQERSNVVTSAPHHQRQAQVSRTMNTSTISYHMDEPDRALNRTSQAFNRRQENQGKGTRVVSLQISEA